MIRIEVKSTVTTQRSGISKKSGNPYELVEQRGWLHGSKDYPTEVSFILGKGQLAFAPGYYVAGPECAEVDRFGNVTLNLQRMRPIPAAQVSKVG